MGHWQHAQQAGTVACSLIHSSMQVGYLPLGTKLTGKNVLASRKFHKQSNLDGSFYKYGELPKGMSDDPWTMATAQHV